MNTKNFDIDERLSSLLREHVIFKYTKSDKKTYQELLSYTIDLEIKYNELQRKVENNKKEIFKSNQFGLDLQLELDESRIKINSLYNQIRMKERTIKFTTGITHLETEVLNNLEKSEIGNRKQNDDSDISISKSSIEELSIDQDLLGTMKKKKKYNRDLESNVYILQEENNNLLNDLNMLVREVKTLRCNIDEKDNIISILYQEVENLKISDIEQKENSMIKNIHKKNEMSLHNISSQSIQKNHIENLDSIKDSLIEFLKYYGVKEDFNKCSSINTNEINDNNEYIIEIRMKEIKYILVNLKKINIIFKTLFMEYSKNLVNLYQKEYTTILNSKLEKMENKLNHFSIIMNKFYNKKQLSLF